MRLYYIYYLFYRVYEEQIQMLTNRDGAWLKHTMDVAEREQQGRQLGHQEPCCLQQNLQVDIDPMHKDRLI